MWLWRRIVPLCVLMSKTRDTVLNIEGLVNHRAMAKADHVGGFGSRSCGLWGRVLALRSAGETDRQRNWQAQCAFLECLACCRLKSEVGFWQNGFFVADLCFEPPDFIADFVTGFLSSSLWEKVLGKSSRKIPDKMLRILYNKNPRHIPAEAAEGPGH